MPRDEQFGKPARGSARSYFAPGIRAGKTESFQLLSIGIANIVKASPSKERLDLAFVNTE
ncbi:MAG: hypothetical protein ACYC3S_08945 [Chloroflexota bacterium]